MFYERKTISSKNLTQKSILWCERLLQILSSVWKHTYSKRKVNHRQGYVFWGYDFSGICFYFGNPFFAQIYIWTKYIQYFSSKCNAFKFYTKFTKIYLLKDSLKIMKIIKIILPQFGSTMGKNIVSQWPLVWSYWTI